MDPNQGPLWPQSGCSQRGHLGVGIWKVVLYEHPVTVDERLMSARNVPVHYCAQKGPQMGLRIRGQMGGAERGELAVWDYYYVTNNASRGCANMCLHFPTRPKRGPGLGPNRGHLEGLNGPLEDRCISRGASPSR